MMQRRRFLREFARPQNILLTLLCLALTGYLFLPAHTSARHEDSSDPQSQPSSSGPTLDSSGSLPTQDAGRLHLATDLGSIVIHTHDAPTLDYHVHLETDSSTRNANALLKSFTLHSQSVADGISMRGATNARLPAGRLWVTIELTVPRHYSLDVSTGVGNINADDLTGHEMLLTQGGNIMVGNIDGSARLTAVAGGHISVKNVTGELTAETGGGHITTGAIGGNAYLHTSGGHIRSDSVAGVAHLVTDGGNITLERAGGELVAETAGGQIQVGEAAGLVRAKTEGGGIRVVRSSGPANLQTADGSIYLTKADGSVKASTATGGITAWIMSPPKDKDTGECELQSTKGDIVVYLGRTVPVTIDAQVQNGQTNGFVIDPAFPIPVHYDDGAHGARVARAEATLNGGGEVLHLRTVAGNIHFVLSSSDKQMQMYRQQMEGMQKQLDEIKKSGFPEFQEPNTAPRQP